jgi:hypothetical protein
MGFLIDAVAHGTRSTSFGGFGCLGVRIDDHALLQMCNLAEIIVRTIAAG